MVYCLAIIVTLMLSPCMGMQQSAQEMRGPDNPLLQKAQYYLQKHNNYPYVRNTLNRIIKQNDDPWAVAEAQYLLGELYYFGRGVPVKKPEAIKFWELASNQTVNEAARIWSLANLGDAYLEKNDVVKAEEA